MKHIPFQRFAKLLFDTPLLVKTGAEVLRAILQARAVDGHSGKDEGE